MALPANKYIIHKNEIHLGNVEFHYELVKSGMEHEKIIGGGRWIYNQELYGEVLFFYGDSFDFGSVTKEQFYSAYENSKQKIFSYFLKELEVVFSAKDFGSALKENAKKQNNNVEERED